MQRLSGLAVSIFAVLSAAIAENILSNSDLVSSCTEKAKLDECAAKMDKIIRDNRDGDGDDSASTLNNLFNLNKGQFDILCRGADAFTGCVDGYHLKEICPNDPLIAQLDGYMYQCSGPQKSVIDSYLTCITKYRANPHFVAPTIDWTKCNHSEPLNPSMSEQDRCRFAQTMMNCMRQVYLDGPCGSVEFYNVFVGSNEKLNPGTKGCHLERATGESNGVINLMVGVWNILHMLTIAWCMFFFQ